MKRVVVAFLIVLLVPWTSPAIAKGTGRLHFSASWWRSVLPKASQLPSGFVAYNPPFYTVTQGLRSYPNATLAYEAGQVLGSNNQSLAMANNFSDGARSCFRSVSSPSGAPALCVGTAFFPRGGVDTMFRAFENVDLVQFPNPDGLTETIQFAMGIGTVPAKVIVIQHAAQKPQLVTYNVVFYRGPILVTVSLSGSGPVDAANTQTVVDLARLVDKNIEARGYLCCFP